MNTRRSKYSNVQTVVGGVTFDSRKEARRYAELLLLLKAGLICNLETQPRYALDVNGQKVGEYRGDFRYTEGPARIVEDVKGVRTPLYVLKRKLMFAIHGITIRETYGDCGKARRKDHG